MPSTLVDPNALPTMTFDWGVIKPLVAGLSPTVSLMHVVLLPGHGHERHNHPDADEILYVLSGAGEQMVDDAQTFPIHAGHTVSPARTLNVSSATICSPVPDST